MVSLPEGFQDINVKLMVSNVYRHYCYIINVKVRKRSKRGFNLWAPMNNCLLTKSMNTLEVSSLLLVGVLLYGTQQSLRCLSFCDLLEGTDCLLLTKLLFWTRVPSFLYVQMRLSQMLICWNLSKFGLTYVVWLLYSDSLIRGKSTSGVQKKLSCLNIAIKLCCLTIAITVYCIWLSRNKLIFEDYQFSVIEIISKIKFLMYRQAHLLHLF